MADLTRLIDSSDPVFQDVVGRDLQGNILRSHRRDNATYLFVRFPNGQAGRDFISRFLGSVTTAADQQNQGTEGIFVGIALSSVGYAALDAPPPRERGAFHTGMARDFAAASFAGVNVAEAFAGDRWHAVITIASNDVDELSDMVDKFREHASSLGLEDHVESGVWKDGKRAEHFGYVDGKSQPRLLANETSFTKWNNRYAPRQALVKDRSGDPESSYGSFLVFWKLEQHVDAFMARFGSDVAAGNRVVGRTRDGQPLVDTPAESKGGPAPLSETNDFDYTADIAGGTCPMASHVRKVNPRRAGDREVQLVRRGIPYGSSADEERGLLFVAHCRNIEGQFETMARSWMGQGFPRTTTPKDALLSKWVTIRGGDYFFAPSKTSLEEIARGANPANSTTS